MVLSHSRSEFVARGGESRDFSHAQTKTHAHTDRVELIGAGSLGYGTGPSFG